MAAGAVVAGIAAGISALVPIVKGAIDASREKKKQKSIEGRQRKHAEDVEKNLQRLMFEMENGEASYQEALDRYNEIMKNVKGELKKAINKEAGIALRNLQLDYAEATEDLAENLEQYRDQMTEQQREQLDELKETVGAQREAIRRSAVQRRLGGSEAERAEQAKLAEKGGERREKLTEAFTEAMGEAEKGYQKQRSRMAKRKTTQEANIRARKSAQLSRAMAGVEQQRAGTMLTGEQQGVQQHLNIVSQVNAMRNYADQLNRALGTSKFAGLSAFMTGYQQAGGTQQVAGGLTKLSDIISSPDQY